jgi:hypothetical protein
MAESIAPALTPEEWEARDRRQVARELDAWANGQADRRHEDATEFVAKLGLTQTGSVVAMNRAHDQVLIPPPARAALAAFALFEQPFGFTARDVATIVAAASQADDNSAAVLRDLAARIQSLLPPTSSDQQGSG